LVYDSTEADSKGISKDINALSVDLCMHLGGGKFVNGSFYM
jgi:hypothetical protein